MPGKRYDFYKMKVYDFNSTSTENSKGNCFGCDGFCDDFDACDMSSGDYLESLKPENIPTDKYKNATSDEVLKSIAVSLEKIAAEAAYRNKLLLELTTDRHGW